MKYTIFCREDNKSIDLKIILEKELNNFLIKDDNNPDCIITIGGDGTMLRAIHQYFALVDKVIFIGLHTGTLGFLTDYQINEIEKLIKLFKSERLDYEKYNLLELEMNNNTYYAVNEIRIENNYHTQIIDVSINDSFLQTVRGNGVCISSSLGSSAYNKALGGAIIDHDLATLQLTEIASINHNQYRSLNTPLVLAKDKVIKLKTNSSNNCIVGIDHLVIDKNISETLKIRVSDKQIKKLKITSDSFTKRLKRAFIV